MTSFYRHLIPLGRVRLRHFLAAEGIPMRSGQDGRRLLPAAEGGGAQMASAAGIHAQRHRVYIRKMRSDYQFVALV